LQESGTGAQKKMAFLESEIRKLWVIAYERNKKAIAENEAGLKKQGAELKSFTSLFSQQAKGVEGLATKADTLTAKLDKHAVTLKENVAKVDKSVASASLLQSEIALLREQNDKLSAQLKTIEDASGSAIAEIRQNVEKLKGAEDVKRRVGVNEVAIEAIDASRLQLNERIVALDRRLNDLQLSIKSAQPTPATAP
jgi:chromosome segregation ATPase